MQQNDSAGIGYPRRIDRRPTAAARRSTAPSRPQPAPEPGGSASCYWNGYGTQCNHPAQRTRQRDDLPLPQTKPGGGPRRGHQDSLRRGHPGLGGVERRRDDRFDCRGVRRFVYPDFPAGGGRVVAGVDRHLRNAAKGVFAAKGSGNTRQRQCLRNEGSGNTRQRRCLTTRPEDSPTIRLVVSSSQSNEPTVMPGPPPPGGAGSGQLHST